MTVFGDMINIIGGIFWVIGILQGLILGWLLMGVFLVNKIKKYGFYETKKFKYYRVDKVEQK